jgi:hypothetical protein
VEGGVSLLQKESAAYFSNTGVYPLTTFVRRSDQIVLFFVIICVFYGAWPVWRAFFPLEIDLKEAWNAYHADAAFGGGLLYPDLTGLTANNYPPLWYYLTGTFARMGVDAIYVGRIASLLSTLALAVIIALCIRSFKTAWLAGALGGLFFFALMVRYADWYVGMNDPNLLALAIMMVGLLLFLRCDPKKGFEGPFLVMVLGGFFKHSLLAIPATALCLLAYRNHWLAIRAAIVSGCAALIGIGALTLLYGTPFIDQMFFYPRELSLGRLWNSLGRLGSLLPGLIVWSVWAWHARATEALRFTTIFMLLSFGTYLLQKLGAGTDVNAQFELNIALSIGVGLAFDSISGVPRFWGLSVEQRQLVAAGILAFGLIAAPGLEPYYLFASPFYRSQFSHNTAVMQSEIRRVAAIPGSVLCSIETVCRAAGKPFTVDVFFAGQKGATGQWTAEEFNSLLMARRIQYEEIDPRAAVGPLQKQLFYGRADYKLTTPASCDGNIEFVNNMIPDKTLVVSSALSVIGWTAIRAWEGVIPEAVFITLTQESGQKLYVAAGRTSRLDVSAYFHQPNIADVGFSAIIDVSGLSGKYVLGVSYTYNGKLEDCAQFRHGTARVNLEIRMQ